MSNPVEQCTLRLGDAVDVLREMAADSIDAVLTDPPYCSGGMQESARRSAGGQGLRSETLRNPDGPGDAWFRGDNMGTSGLAFLLRSVAFELLRVCKPTASFLVFCDWRMVSVLQPAIESAGWRFQNLIVWDKGQPGLGRGFRAQHELLLHMTAGEPEYHNQHFGNVLRCSRVHSTQREHPTEKPVALLRDLLQVIAPPDGLVLDPFAGSGSTGVACAMGGWRFFGIERDQAHLATARRRITGTPRDANPQQANLFATPAPAPIDPNDGAMRGRGGSRRCGD